MNKEFIRELLPKIVRCLIVGTMFLFLLTLQGISNMRNAQQMILMLAAITLFSFMLKNIWWTLFLCWTVFLYAFFKFEVGGAYLTNIFCGCILYLLIKKAFKKKHIDFFINGVLWFTFANVIFMALQISGFDFVFDKVFYSQGIKQFTENIIPSGFMGHISLMGCLMALSVPLLATRRSKWALVGVFGLFVPLYLSYACLCVLMAVLGLLFVLWFKLPKKVWIISVLVLIIAGSSYFKYVDRPGTARFGQWKAVLKDNMIHPITGWGLDSFKSFTSYKDFRYSAGKEQIFNHPESKKRVYVKYWDNPHNLYISLWYEFGLIGLFLFFGYIRQCVLRFKNAIKYPNTIALAGFIFVLLGISVGHFPIFLARFSIPIIGAFALYEVSTQ